MTETSSASPTGVRREPPAAAKAVSGRGVKTLPSCGEERHADPGGPRRAPPTPTARRAAPTSRAREAVERKRAAAKVRWYREDPARPHLSGDALRNQREVPSMQRILSHQLAARGGATGHVA